MYLTNCALGPIVLSKDSSRKTTARPAVSAQDWLLGSILGGNLSLVVSGYFSVRSKWGRMCVYSSFPYLFPCLQNALRFVYQGKRMLAFNRHVVLFFENDLPSLLFLSLFISLSNSTLFQQPCLVLMIWVGTLPVPTVRALRITRLIMGTIIASAAKIPKKHGWIASNPVSFIQAATIGRFESPALQVMMVKTSLLVYAISSWKGKMWHLMSQTTYRALNTADFLSGRRQVHLSYIILDDVGQQLFFLD